MSCLSQRFAISYRYITERRGIVWGQDVYLFSAHPVCWCKNMSFPTAQPKELSRSNTASLLGYWKTRASTTMDIKNCKMMGWLKVHLHGQSSTTEIQRLHSSYPWDCAQKSLAGIWDLQGVLQTLYYTQDSYTGRKKKLQVYRVTLLCVPHKS